MKLLKEILIAAVCAVSAIAAPSVSAATRPEVVKPDLDKIKVETTDEASMYYYPKLLQMFMANDTVMTEEDFRYFYYGTLFQEDYDPYRTTYDEEEYKRIEPLYYKNDHTRAEKDLMQEYAQAAIGNNPIDLLQLKNLIYVYEKKGKVNLAKIWKNKLNHLLLTIASSGTGLDADNAWMVVFPRHEYDFLNLVGITALSQEFVPPYYEKLGVGRKTDKDPEAYYFNIKAILEQYYLKHPSEL